MLIDLHTHAHTDIHYYSYCGGSEFQKSTLLYIYECIYIGIKIHTHINTNIHTHVHDRLTRKSFKHPNLTHIHMCIYVYIYRCIFISIYTHKYAYAYIKQLTNRRFKKGILSIHIHIHVNTHVHMHTNTHRRIFKKRIPFRHK